MAHFKHGKIIEDLSLLISLLKKYKFEDNNLIELHRLQNLIGKGTDIFYNYKTVDLLFNISTSGMSANPSTVKKVAVILDLDYQFEETLNEKSDCFKNYSLNIYLRGFDQTNAGQSEYTNFFCWHLDRETNTDGNYSHPFYHFHAGGNHLDGRDLGDLLMISSPRLPHPPMDIILVIHFVLNNFFHKEDFPTEIKILSDYDYIDMIKRAEKRLLDPYFSTFSAKGHLHFTPHNLFPLYYN